ncbi:MAG: hypothetical protein IBJ09_11635 [Bacteroidia bacterium]|nr:hypothetical protein [Bacteroidia bacterium]
MKFIRILDLSLQLLVLSAALLLGLFSDPFRGLLFYSLVIAVVQTLSHMFYYLRERDKRRLTRGRRIFHTLFRALVFLLACLGLSLLLHDLGIHNELLDSYLHLYSFGGLAILGIPASLYYIGLSMYELRMYLYLQAQSEAVDFGA